MILADAGNFGLSYVLEWIAFVFVVVFIWRYVAPPLNRAMSAKREQIRSQLAERDELAAAAEALIAERRTQLESARAEAREIVEQAHRSAAALVQDGRRRAEEERARIVARAGAEIDAANSRARAEVIAEVGSLVVDAAEQIVVAELDETNQRRLIDEAIAATESEVSA